MCPANDAETEERLVSGDVAGRGGRVAVHEEFVGDVDEAQRAEQNKEQIPESNHSSWIAGPAHVPSVVERVRSEFGGGTRPASGKFRRKSPTAGMTVRLGS